MRTIAPGGRFALRLPLNGWKFDIEQTKNDPEWSKIGLKVGGGTIGEFGMGH